MYSRFIVMSTLTYMINNDQYKWWELITKQAFTTSSLFFFWNPKVNPQPLLYPLSFEWIFWCNLLTGVLKCTRQAPCDEFMTESQMKAKFDMVDVPKGSFISFLREGRLDSLYDFGRFSPRNMANLETIIQCFLLYLFWCSQLKRQVNEFINWDLLVLCLFINWDNYLWNLNTFWNTNK